ncbi:CoA transferase [Paraburkholderia sp. BL27I4N3]|uniref:CoA transferase n=1 Tax=Paraburkholderia sp. BL27I4N3 TaxID=1938805 RepID=UPI000E238AD7|nr:CoA transferase [Paraburkholderia sp. BL27I4N3]
MDDLTASTVRTLLSQIGIELGDMGGRVRVIGSDPIVRSPHRLGTAAASALAAQGAAIATIWRMKTGRGQDVTVDMRQATKVGLRTNLCLRQNGYYLDHLAPGDGGPANFFRTRDNRWIFIHRSTVFPETLYRLLDFLGCPLSAAGVAKAVSHWDALELENALAERKLIAAVARTTNEWQSHEQGRWLGAQPEIRIEKIGESSPEPFKQPSGQRARPLSNLRVLDMTHVLAGPICGRVLAEQGADVLRISAPHRQDPLPMVMDTNFGKRAAYVDLDRADDCSLLSAMLRDADVFVQSFRPGVCERRGLGPDDLARIRPGIIYVSVSCYGDGGPWATRGGYEPLSQTANGLAIDEGSYEQPRFAPTRTLNDLLAAYLAATGALGALIRRAREGGSYHVKVSLTGASMWVQKLGRLQDDEWRNVSNDLTPHPADLMRTQSCFGELEHAAPIARFSETPAFWDKPPTCLGADSLRWLDRR